jgi:ketosteroid isomerase-like protein
VSQENVELPNRVYDALNRRDLDGLLDLMDAEVEFMPILVDVEGGYRGHAGVRHWWESMFDTVPDFAAKVDGVRDLGALTLATVRPGGHGSTSGAPVEQRLSQVIHWHNAKAVRLESFRSEAEALKAVGLEQ